MPGEEIVVTAAVEAARAALSDDASVKARLAEMANESPEMERAAKALARRIEIKQVLLLKLYQPLAKLAGMSKDYFNEPDGFAEDMAARIADVPDEHLTSPPPYLAVPAMTGLGFSLDEPSLKSMYLNLLANATDDRTLGRAHPSYADVIRQLSPHEAVVLKQALQKDSVAMLETRRKHPVEKGYLVAFTHAMEPLSEESELAASNQTEAVWVGNWVRLGLVTVSYAESFTYESRYDWVEDRQDLRDLRESASRQEPEWAVEAVHGLMEATAFGRGFLASIS